VGFSGDFGNCQELPRQAWASFSANGEGGGAGRDGALFIGGAACVGEACGAGVIAGSTSAATGASFCVVPV